MKIDDYRKFKDAIKEKIMSLEKIKISKKLFIIPTVKFDKWLLIFNNYLSSYFFLMKFQLIHIIYIIYNLNYLNNEY